MKSYRRTAVLALAGLLSLVTVGEAVAQPYYWHHHHYAHRYWHHHGWAYR